MNGPLFALLVAAVLAVIVGSILAGRRLSRRSGYETALALSMAAAAGGATELAGDASVMGQLTDDQAAECAFQEWLTRNETAALRAEVAADREWMDVHGWPTGDEVAALLAAHDAAQEQLRANAAMDAAIEILADGDTHAMAMLIVQSWEWPPDWVDRLEQALHDGVLV